MRRLSLGSAALLVLAWAQIARAEPRVDPVALPPDPPRVSVPVGLRAEPGHAPSIAPSAEGFSGSMRARLASAPLLVVPDPSSLLAVASNGTPKTTAIFGTLAPRAAVDRVGIGRTVRLGHGRALVMDLTPSPAHCAPLVSLTF